MRIQSGLHAALVVATMGACACGGPDPSPDSGGGGDDTGNVAVDAPGLDAPRTDAPTLDAPVPSGVLVRAAEGGIVESSDGLFEIYVFPGALAEDTTITITRVAEADVPADITALSPISAVYSVEPDGLTFGGDGAFAHYTFASVPDGLVLAGSPTEYANVELVARPAVGGATEQHGDTLDVYEADGTFHAVARLVHLSYQWVRRRLAEGDMRLGVDWPAEVHEVGTTFHAPSLLEVPESVRDRLVRFSVHAGNPRVIAAVATPGAIPSTTYDRGSYRLLTPLLFEEHSEPGFAYSLGAAATSGSVVLSPTPRWRCESVGRTRIVIAADVLEPGERPDEITIAASRVSACVEPTPIEVSILDTIHGEREELAVSVGFAPQLEARVETRPATTRTVSMPGPGGEPTPWFATLSPAGDPAAAGPGPITATNSGATMTAMPDATTGDYLTVIDDPAIWQSDAPTSFAIGGVVSDVMPPSPPAVTFGPVDGLDTMIMPSDPDAELDVRVRIPGTTSCMGSDVRDLVFWRRLDGSTVSVPVREGIELAAALCGRTVAELTGGDFYIDVGTRSSEVIDLGLSTVRVTTGRGFELDGRDLVATCPAGRSYCTDACVNTATDPLNCGGCGLMPPEICDTVDNDCDGVIDDGCPRTLDWGGGSALVATIAGTAAPVSMAGAICSGSSFLSGLCGNVDTMTGNVRSLRPICAFTTLVRPTAATPDEYQIQVTSSACGSLGGGSSGGTPFTMACPANTFLDGFEGVTGAYVGQLRGRCSAYDVQRRGDGTWGVVRTGSTVTDVAMAGTGTGTPFTPFILRESMTTAFPGSIRMINLLYTTGTTAGITSMAIYGTWPSLGY